MKKTCFVFFALLLWLPVRGQGGESALSDTLYSVLRVPPPVAFPGLKLPKYEPAACVFPALRQLIGTDKGCGEAIGYYFSTEQTQGKELIKVAPVDLRRVRSGTFFGYFRLGNRVFLCHGTNKA
ncbi:hypothetical protein GCM10011375_38510 [Hymenobacter qilianensis]|uniref:Uncharacterized protein n=2 Tax=Hymenobacter qilianensis TaxID=1385715 RepID=A0ACB5PWQ0_9BACT|nr:hypothetical protein [Hymenobacter qilianensis]QNP54254.1 hypothetical protein H9L05_21510 [Hymenobacter qilianensis]GGF79739.1 hypothetical protein GCM10011375_38510 [Hymenobacter qilianensis]